MDPAVAAFLQSLQAAGLSQTQIATLATVQHDPVTWSALYNAQIRQNAEQAKPAQSTDSGTGEEFVTEKDRGLGQLRLTVAAVQQPAPRGSASDLIHLPDWGRLAPFFEKIEHRVDSALSSANSILNFVLGPVRHFVGAVLHPLFALADTVFDWASSLVIHVMSEAIVLAFSVIDAIERVAGDSFHLFLVGIDTAVTEARKLVDDVRAFVSYVVGQTVNLARQLAADAVNVARSAVADALDVARGLVEAVHNFAAFIVGQAIALLRGLIDDVRAFATFAVEHAVALTHALVDDVRAFVDFAVGQAVDLARSLAGAAEQLAHDLVSALWRDVIKPIEDALTSFLDHEWRWAFNLLKVLEDAASWIVWVGKHLVPEAVATWETLRDLLDADVDALADIGISLANPHH